MKATNDYFVAANKGKPQLKLGKRIDGDSFASVHVNDYVIKPNSLRDGFLQTTAKEVVLCRKIVKENNEIVFRCKKLAASAVRCTSRSK